MANLVAEFVLDAGHAPAAPAKTPAKAMAEPPRKSRPAARPAARAVADEDDWKEF
jgi:hypothetical protein